MVREREKRFGRIDKAYCFELDAVLDAYQALARGIQGRNFHFYCPTPGCGWKLSGGPRHDDQRADYEIAWFVGEDIPAHMDRSHDAQCKYGMKRQVSRGSGKGVSTPLQIPVHIAQPFIPSELVDPSAARLKRWLGKDPDPEVLKNLIAAALGKPMSGSLEEVVDAERFLAKQYLDFLDRKKTNPTTPPPAMGKPQRSLMIASRITNYRDGIVDFFGKLGHIEDQAFLKEHVVHCTCDVIRDEHNSFEYLLLPSGGQFTISVDIRAVGVSPLKSYMKPLLEAQAASTGMARVKCYLWDLQPLTHKDGERPTFRIASPGSLIRMAIREVSSKVSSRNQSQDALDELASQRSS